jgi:hypothetical protein
LDERKCPAVRFYAGEVRMEQTIQFWFKRQDTSSDPEN